MSLIVFEEYVFINYMDVESYMLCHLQKTIALNSIFVKIIIGLRINLRKYFSFVFIFWRNNYIFFIFLHDIISKIFLIFYVLAQLFLIKTFSFICFIFYHDLAFQFQKAKWRERNRERDHLRQKFHNLKLKGTS